MKTFRVVFHNFVPKLSSRERVENLLKNLYWQKGQEPEDWNLFDGDITVKTEQPRGGDCASVRVSEKWAQWTIDHLQKQQDIRWVEIKFKDSDLEFVKKNKPSWARDTSNLDKVRPGDFV